MTVDYKPLYHKLFNACTDALNDMEKQNFGQASFQELIMPSKQPFV